MVKEGRKDILGREKYCKKRLSNFKLKIKKNQELAQRFLELSELKGVKHNRILKYLTTLEQLEKWSNKSFDKITKEDMQKILLELQRGDLSEETINTYKTIIKTIFKRLFGNDEDFPDSVRWIRRNKVKTEVKYLTKEEVEKLARHCKDFRWQMMIKILFITGLRSEEFLNLKLSDIKRKGDNISFVVRVSKTQSRIVPLLDYQEEFLEYLEFHKKQYDNEEFLFPIQYRTLWTGIRRYGERALGKKISPHWLRRSLATHLSEEGWPENSLRYYFGWAPASRTPAKYIFSSESLVLKPAESYRNETKSSRVSKENKTLQEQIQQEQKERQKLQEQIQKLQEDLNSIVEGVGSGEITIS